MTGISPSKCPNELIESRIQWKSLKTMVLSSGLKFQLYAQLFSGRVQCQTGYKVQIRHRHYSVIKKRHLLAIKLFDILMFPVQVAKYQL